MKRIWLAATIAVGFLFPTGLAMADEDAAPEATQPTGRQVMERVDARVVLARHEEDRRIRRAVLDAGILGPGLCVVLFLAITDKS